jgi:HK97 family phage major capsid protein
MVRNDLVSAMAQAEDNAFIRSDGSAASPRGIKSWAASTQASAGSTLANMITDLEFLLLALKNANVRFIQPGWMMSPRTELALMTVTNTNGFYMFRQEMLTGNLWKIPYATSTQIPINISGSGSEMYLVDFADVVIGESKQLILDTSTEAAFNDGTGMQSSFQQDQTVIRAIAEHDLVMRHDLSAAYLSAVPY